MSTVASEMISFARTNPLVGPESRNRAAATAVWSLLGPGCRMLQAGQTQSVDVLSSGLANIQSALEQSRLHLALSDLHADCGRGCAPQAPRRASVEGCAALTLRCAGQERRPRASGAAADDQGSAPGRRRPPAARGPAPGHQCVLCLGRAGLARLGDLAGGLLAHFNTGNQPSSRAEPELGRTPRTRTLGWQTCCRSCGSSSAWPRGRAWTRTSVRSRRTCTSRQRAAPTCSTARASCAWPWWVGALQPERCAAHGAC